jgi:SAM-dependent methyltransferase
MTDHHHDHSHTPGQGHSHAHDQEPTKAPVTPAEWDEMYAEANQVWSGNPNIALVTEAADLTVTSALDVGCGEGADAIWLAQQGWRVSAFDVSTVALDRAGHHAADAGVEVDFHQGGLLDVDLPESPFDLVSVHFGVLQKQAGQSLARLLELVAPGGTLLFVHHADMTPDDAKQRGFDLADYLMPADVRDGLGDGWEVRVFEQRARHVESGRGAGHTSDLVLRARRESA